MPGLSFSNELISQDKGLHCDFACLLYSKLVNQLLELQIVEIIRSAVKIEMKFVVDVFPIELIGMNSAMMCNLHQILHQSTHNCLRMPLPLQSWKSIWIDGNNKLTGKDKLLQKTCWRILEIGCWIRPHGPNFCS